MTVSSLHTKYRPLTFEEVLGQEHIVPSLRQAAKDNRAHAFIFVGPSGVGKTTLARILANRFAGNQATAANIEEVDAATNSGADSMRNIVNRSIYRAIGVSPVKALIVDEAHRLSAAAWTILLKPIEEPPAHVYWMLCTTDPGKIPQTIQTRCLKYNLKPVREELLYELLQAVAEAEALAVNADVLAAISEAAGGSPRQALVFLEGCSGAQSVADAQALMRSATQNKEAIELARWLVSGRGRTWAEAMKHVQALNGVDAEGVRIMLVTYLTKVLQNTKEDRKASALLALLEPFMGAPYNASDGMAPLMHSIGLALNLDQQ